MIQSGSTLKSADNTDIKKMRCIKVFGSNNKTYANSGDIIKISVHKRTHLKNIIKKKIYLALIISIKKKKPRGNGVYFLTDYNRALTLSDQLKFLGTRVYGPITKEVRSSKKKRANFKKIISYSKCTI